MKQGLIISLVGIEAREGREFRTLHSHTLARINRTFEGTEGVVLEQVVYEDGAELFGNHYGSPSDALRELMARHAPKNPGAVA